MDVEKHQSSPAAGVTKSGKDASREPANWTFSTGPVVSSDRRRGFGRTTLPSRRLFLPFLKPNERRVVD
jgi:hypothetical protein